MNYGLTIYGPFVDTLSAREDVYKRLKAVFSFAPDKQVYCVWQTMRDYPYFNNVEVVQRLSGDLLVHVYGSPLHVPEDADCLFHAKISPGGTYA